VKKNIIHIYILSLIVISCTNKDEEVTALPYDPPGAIITTDKEISTQHIRTISFSNTGVFVSNEFPGSRLNDFYQVNESTYTAVIEPENAPINDSPWYSFKIWSNKEQNIILNLTYKDGTHRYKPKISYDGKYWVLFDTTNVFIDTTINTASLKLNLNMDTLWISGQELITYGVYINWIDKLAEKKIVRKDTIGRSSQGNPIYKMEIGEKENTRYIVIIGRNHPPEVTGFFALKTLTETLAGDSDLAEEFRKSYTTVVIPLVNPDGVEFGHWRHNAKGVDLNRDWVEFNQPEPRAVKNEVEKILSDPNNKIHFFIDFHSTTEDVFYTFTMESLVNNNISEERINKRKEDYHFINQWLQNLQLRLPGYQVNIVDSLSKSTSPTSDRWIMREYDVPGITYEVGDETDRDLIKRVAETAAAELMEILLSNRK
jgi:murein tripeptide amidase MpaA